MYRLFGLRKEPVRVFLLSRLAFSSFCLVNGSRIIQIGTSPFEAGVSCLLSSVVERVTCNDEVSRSIRLGGNGATFFLGFLASLTVRVAQ